MSYESCPKCGKVKHFLNACKICGFKRTNYKLKTKRKAKAKANTKKEKIGRIILISKRGKKLTGIQKCSYCKKQRSDSTMYSKSNRGPVTLCERCKIIIREKSFGAIYVDAMSHMANK